VSFQCHFNPTGGKSGFPDFACFITDCNFGITSPLLIISIFAPGPRTLSTMNFALLPVARFISTPPIVTGSNINVGFKYPSLEIFHSISNIVVLLFDLP
jgi:hypothetical protein